MKRIIALVLTVMMLLSVVACSGGTAAPAATSEGSANSSTATNTADSKPADSAGNEETPKAAFTVSEDDEEIYMNNLGEFYEYYQNAVQTSKSDSERWAKLALAEAKFLETGCGTPMYAPFVSYSLTRLVYNTSGFAPWRGTMTHWGEYLITNEIILKEDYDALKEIWNETRGTGTYLDSAKKYLTDKGYTFADTYRGTFTDIINSWSVWEMSTGGASAAVTSAADFLFAYNSEGTLVPHLAESYEMSEDGKVYTIHLKKDQIWVDSQGRYVDDVQADDWVASAQHMADILGWYFNRFTQYVENAAEYYNGEITDFGEVGIKALDKYTLQYTLKEPCPYFMTLSDNLAFYPLCRSYYLSQGGAFGQAEYAAAAASPSYTYGIDQNHIPYCGQFICTNMTEKNSITCVLNPNYWNAENATLKAVELVYDDGSDVARNYENFKNGLNYSMYLNSALMETAKNNGDFDKYAVTNPPNKATFLLWFNLNRKTYANVADGALASRKTDEQKEITRAALQNKHFRLALAYSIDRPLYIVQNTVEELKYANNRNTLTPGDYVSLLEDVTIDINGTPTTFPKGTWYGAIVQAQLTADEFPIKVWDEELQTTDFPDAWHQPELAKKEMELAIEELATLGYKVSKENPIVLDYYNPVIDETSARQSYVLKTCIESGTDGNVFVDLIDMNAWSERNNMLNNVNYGYEVNEDMGGLGTVGSDHGDPQCFTEGLLPYGDGYMVIRMGLW